LLFFNAERPPRSQLQTAGLSYEDLLQRIVNLGLRWRPELRG
jgi:hypothetical protein